MAHFPQPHSRLRSPRVRIPTNEPMQLKLGKKQVPGVLHRLSLTGGLVELQGETGELGLAEVVLISTSGPIKALVEFLRPQGKEKSASRAFRFVALDDPDFNRLSSTLQSMRKRGWAENSR